MGVAPLAKLSKPFKKVGAANGEKERNCKKVMVGELIIDAHVHTYPTAEIGKQAMQGAGQSGCSGTVEELLSVMARGKISYAVQANMTPTYDMKTAALKNLARNMSDEERERAEKDIDEKVIARMKRRNLWTCTVARENPALIPLISVDLLQTASDMEGEIEDKVEKQGSRGLKLHPVSNRFYPHDRKLWPAYAKAMEMGLPILFHSGESEIAGYTNAEYARPRYFEQVLQSFPRLIIILAHLGKGFLDESVQVAQKYNNVFFDTSAIISGTELKGGLSSDAQAVELIRKIGIPKIFFGSDWPWYDPLPAIEWIRSLDLAEEEKRRILGKNAAEIFSLKSFNARIASQK